MLLHGSLDVALTQASRALRRLPVSCTDYWQCADLWPPLHTSVQTEPLRKLAEALHGTLELYSADLTTPGSFDEAVR